mgnify:CR=1 FL=1
MENTESCLTNFQPKDVSYYNRDEAFKSVTHLFDDSQFLRAKLLINGQKIPNSNELVKGNNNTTTMNSSSNVNNNGFENASKEMMKKTDNGNENEFSNVIIVSGSKNLEKGQIVKNFVSRQFSKVQVAWSIDCHSQTTLFADFLELALGMKVMNIPNIMSNEAIQITTRHLAAINAFWPWVLIFDKFSPETYEKFNLLSAIPFVGGTVILIIDQENQNELSDFHQNVLKQVAHLNCHHIFLPEFREGENETIFLSNVLKSSDIEPFTEKEVMDSIQQFELTSSKKLLLFSSCTHLIGSLPQTQEKLEELSHVKEIVEEIVETVEKLEIDSNLEANTETEKEKEVKVETEVETNLNIQEPIKEETNLQETNQQENNQKLIEKENVQEPIQEEINQEKVQENNIKDETLEEKNDQKTLENGINQENLENGDQKDLTTLDPTNVEKVEKKKEEEEVLNIDFWEGLLIELCILEFVKQFPESLPILQKLSNFDSVGIPKKLLKITSIDSHEYSLLKNMEYCHLIENLTSKAFDIPVDIQKVIRKKFIGKEERKILVEDLNQFLLEQLKLLVGEGHEITLNTYLIIPHVEAFLLKQRSEFQPSLCDLYLESSKFYSLVEDFQKEQWCLEKALEIEEENEQEGGMKDRFVIVISLLIVNYIRSKNFKKALSYLTRVGEVIDTYIDDLSDTEGILNIANLFSQFGQHGQAKRMYELAFELATKLKDVDSMQEIRDVLKDFCSEWELFSDILNE